MTENHDRGHLLDLERGRIQKQIQLPWSKAIEISLKSVQVRFWRSLITMSGVILAIAFLMSVWTSNAYIAKFRSLSDENKDKSEIELLLQKQGVDVSEEVQNVLLIGNSRNAPSAKGESPYTPFARILESNKDISVTIVEPSDDLSQKIKAYDCVIMDGISPEICTEYFLTELKAYVKAGAGLVFLGAPDVKTLGTKWNEKTRTLLNDLLPVEFSEPLKTVTLKNLKAVHHPTTRGVRWDSLKGLQVYAAKAKPQARVLVKGAHGEVVLSCAKYANGRVVAYTVKDPISKSQLEWPGAAVLYVRCVRWAVGGRAALAGSSVQAKDIWLICLSLLVCVVGIVNAMLMSVSERTREIGTMKCLGALDTFILKVFLIESSFQGLIGTALGITLGFLLTFIRSLFSYGWYALTYFPAVRIGTYAVAAVVIGFVLSVVAALYPAYRAANMEPVEAMRVEE